MKRIIYLLCAIAFMNDANAQIFFTRNGMISFFSKSPLENISAVNNQVVSVLNTTTGEIKFSVIIKGFQFKKALMQEHFNENYMESEKYRRATFIGTLAGIGKIDLSKNGDYKVAVSGELMMHGVTKRIIAPAVITVNAGKFAASASFSILLSDYDIGIPKIVEKNIPKSIEIKVDCSYQPKS